MNTLILYFSVCTILFIAYLVITAKTDGQIRLGDVKFLFLFSYVPVANILFVVAALVHSYENAGGERMIIWKRKKND
jgi:hypothetical protein